MPFLIDLILFSSKFKWAKCGHLAGKLFTLYLFDHFGVWLPQCEERNDGR